MDHLHVHQPKNKENDKSFQADQHRNSVQNYQYYSTAHETKANQQFTTNRQEWDI